jgi:D-alanyl-D-alanine carboxypeptidase
VLQLAQQGRLSLDATIDCYVPDLPNGDRITLRDLLAMRSGLYDYVNDPTLFGEYLQDPLLPGFSVDRALGIVRAHAADSVPPDTTTVYTNTNYLLLGMVIEQASGTSTADYLDHVARRLGLHETTYATTPDLPAPYAHGYYLDDDPRPRLDATESSVDFAGAAGAIVSTVPDMLRYAPELAAGAGLDAASRAERFTYTPLTTTGIMVSYGLGVTKFGDWVGHDGSIAGYSTVVVHLPASDTSLVVMLNAADGNQVPALLPFVQVARLLYPDSLPTY